MRASFFIILFAFGQLGAVLPAQEQATQIRLPNAPGSAIYLTHVTVIDTETGREARNRTVIISGDRILEINDSKDIKAPAGARVVDGTNKYLIPGLWDMHTHAVRPERMKSMFPMFIANGVLGIRDIGTDMKVDNIDPLRKQIADGSLLGPRLVATGQILDGRPKPASATFEAVTTSAEGREAVRSLKAGGADFIKVYSWLSRDAYFAIVEEAKKQSMPLVGHVPMSVTVLEASDAGQKSIEHLTGVDLACSAREDEIRGELLKRGTEMTNETRWSLEAVEAIASYSEEKATNVFAHLARNHTWQVPTFVAFLQDAQFNDSRVTGDARLKYIPPSIQKKWDEYARQHAGASPWDKVFEKRLRIVGEMHRAGVPMLAGTDAGWGVPYIYAGFSLHDELGLLVRAGLTPFESLQTATINPARFLGKTKDLGTIEKGKIADLVLLDGDPLVDIHNTTRISEVFLAGKEWDRTALDGMLETARDAAAMAQATADVDALRRLACEAGHAYAKRDIAALEGLTAADYVQTDVRGGVLNRAQWLDFVRNRKSELSIDCDSVEVRLYGDTAVVTGGWTYTKLLQDKNSTARSRWTSVWTKSGTEWKRHAFQNTYVNPNADRCAYDLP